MVQITHNLKGPRMSHACDMRVTRVAWLVLWLQTRVSIEKHTRVHAHSFHTRVCFYTHACMFVYVYIATHSYLACTPIFVLGQMLDLLNICFDS